MDIRGPQRIKPRVLVTFWLFLYHQNWTKMSTCTWNIKVWWADCNDIYWEHTSKRMNHFFSNHTRWTFRHTHFCPAFLQLLLRTTCTQSQQSWAEWMTVCSVLPSVTNHAGWLGGKQSLRPKMKAKKESPSKAKIISQILLLACLGFFNSGMSHFLLKTLLQNCLVDRIVLSNNGLMSDVSLASSFYQTFCKAYVHTRL